MEPALRPAAIGEQQRGERGNSSEAHTARLRAKTRVPRRSTSVGWRPRRNSCKGSRGHKARASPARTNSRETRHDMFGVGLDHFFREEQRPAGTCGRAQGDSIRLPEKAGRTFARLLLKSLDCPVSDRKLNGYYVEFGKEDEQSEPHEHPGAEIIYVLDGELVVNLEGEDFTLGQANRCIRLRSSAHLPP